MSAEKEQLLSAFGRWNAFIADLGKYDERYWNQSVASGKWSVREVVAHILKWDEYFYKAAISKIEEGIPLAIQHLDYDQFNDAAKEYGLSTPVTELVSEAIASRQRIIHTIAAFSEEQYGGVYMDVDGQPFETVQYLKDFIWHDNHHVEPIKRLLQLRIEEMSLNGWPALQTVLYDGWFMRFAAGYTKRSNSVHALYGQTYMLDTKISECERRYSMQNLNTVFKVTPFIQPANLDEVLAARGYERMDQTVIKTVHLTDVKKPSHVDVWLEDEPTENWLDALTVFSGLSDMQRAITQNMLEQSPLIKCFATLQVNGIPVAAGYAAIEDGWVGLYDIVTDVNERSKGYGEQLVLHLLHWGKEQGATESYLMVVKNNEAANRLYDKIGYISQYEYWYRVKSSVPL
ncbi:GNAT family N-acetyltransferase [Paenibacillus sp. 2TAB23]|uniref:GNAT family N-acetyltransferase n=1 Tax=Paenibacillus sp. 2TAB23 TaxID=3233004 RepID=UPI003F9C9E67